MDNKLEENKLNRNDKENEESEKSLSIKNRSKEKIEISQKIVDINKLIGNTSIKIIYFFISEFGLIFIMGLILFILFLTPQYHSAKTFTSKKTNKLFDSNYNPLIFIHTTDIHISPSKPKKLDGSTIFLTSIYEYRPDFFLLTGDIVDNFIGNPKKIGGQNQEGWKIFDTSVRNFMSKYTVIDVAGNHDLWGLATPTSENNKFLDYSFMFNRTYVKNDDDFYLRKIKMFNIIFILFNDYRFPIFRPPYGAENHITKENLDKLEKMIDNLEEDDNMVFILSHYPIDRAFLTKSSKGHTISEIISNKKIGFLFTGHHHPRHVKIIHHGEEGGLEFCTSSAFDKKRAGLITIDNDNLIYHDVHIPYIGKKPLFFLTYPVPNEQISGHHIFNLNSFEIRVISYAPSNNINLKIEGDIVGDLNYIKSLKNGAFLYSHPVNLPDGSYKIHIYDENGYSCNINTEFTIGNKYEGKKEKYIYNIRFLLASRFMLIPFWIFLLIIVIPFKPNLKFDIVHKIELYIEGNTNIGINKYLIWLYTIVFGPFIIRLRYQKENNILRYIIFIAFLYPIVLPIHFFLKFDGMVGYSFFIFMASKSGVFYEHWALQISFIYYVTIIFPFILFLSGKTYYYKKSIIIIVINSLITVFAFVLGFIINFTTLNQSLPLYLLFFTTAFIIIWIILLIFSIKFF